jgi:hypothetical protein
MSRLTVLRDKDPKEVARLLSGVAASLLPNPTISSVLNETNVDPEFVKIVLSEIKARLRVRQSDESTKIQSQIYAFLSQEISEATLTREAVGSVEARLGNRGELHPNQYEVRFHGATLERLQAAGNRANNIIEVVTNPDHLVHLKSKYVSDEYDPRVTISTKSIATRRTEDKFILFVMSRRVGRIQYVGGAYRVYVSDVKIDDPSDPLDVVRSFAKHLGTTFYIGDKVSKFMLHEAVARDDITISDVKVPDFVADHRYGIVLIGGKSSITAVGGEAIFEIVLAFVLDLTKYLADLRRHHVTLSPQVEDLLGQPGSIAFSSEDFKG